MDSLLFPLPSLVAHFFFAQPHYDSPSTTFHDSSCSSYTPSSLWLTLLLGSTPPSLVWYKAARVTIDDTEGDPMTRQGTRRLDWTTRLRSM